MDLKDSKNKGILRQGWLKQQRERWWLKGCLSAFFIFSSQAYYRRRLGLAAIFLFSLLVVTQQPVVSANLSAFNKGTVEITETIDVSSYRNPGFLLASNRSDVSTDALIMQGQRQYADGQLSTALQSWRDAAESESQPMLRAIAWSYVSIAAQDLGSWEQADAAIAQSLALVASSPQGKESDRIWAQVLNAQGRLNLKKGQPETAWEIWVQAEAAYNRADDLLGSIGAQINQSQALQTMGLYRRASSELVEITEKLTEEPDSEVKAIALKSLGNILQTSGSLQASRQYLNESLALQEKLGNNAMVADTLFTLANTLRLIGDTDGALNQYERVEARSPSALLKVKALLNRFSLMLDMQQWQKAQQLVPAAFDQVKALPPSRDAIYSRVNLAESILSHGDDAHQPMTWVSVEIVAGLLREGAEQARFLQDGRAEALSLGELSKVYEHTQQWSDAQGLAQRALALSQRSNAQDILYRWQHQLGRVYHQQGKDAEAIASYTSAFNTLSEVRRDLLATNTDVQYSFRETVEPIYRELVSLLLLPDDASQSSLRQAREVIEALQLAELENYFKSACVDSTTEYIDSLDSKAAVLYPIVLADRVEVVTSLPNLPLRHSRTWQSAEVTNQTIDNLFQYLNPALSNKQRLGFSEQIYDWLIRPVESELSKNNIDTLVFVLDGKFRSIPMAALYDGQQYLLEKYSVALTPGLKLLGPHFQDPKPLQALMLGLSEARDGFSALPGVKAEIEQAATRVNAEVLFNEDFTKQNLANEIDRVPFPILHIATHGQFSSDLEKTFLLAWDQRLTIGDLDDLLRLRRQQAEPIELMVLSACQTAEGDDRATLGLAGMAIRSGARSTLATLWAVNDASTAELMTAFYQALENSDLSKADALRLAQIKVLKDPQFSHPFYWSPFVLIGNWLS